MDRWGSPRYWFEKHCVLTGWIFCLVVGVSGGGEDGGNGAEVFFIVFNIVCSFLLLLTNYSLTLNPTFFLCYVDSALTCKEASYFTVQVSALSWSRTECKMPNCQYFVNISVTQDSSLKRLVYVYVHFPILPLFLLIDKECIRVLAT